MTTPVPQAKRAAASTTELPSRVENLQQHTLVLVTKKGQCLQWLWGAQHCACGQCEVVCRSAAGRPRWLRGGLVLCTGLAAQKKTTKTGRHATVKVRQHLQYYIFNWIGTSTLPTYLSMSNFFHRPCHNFNKDSLRQQLISTLTRLAL